MPMITVRYTGSEDAANLRSRVAHLFTDIASRTLGKSPEVTVVIAEPVDRAAWFVGRAALATGLAAFWLQITVTAGTNTGAESAAFVGEAFAGMRMLLGPLDERSYVLVQAVDGDGHGYGGRTQNSRRIEAEARRAGPQRQTPRKTA